jgi:predicted ArsR family transcriptional regulator
MGQSRTGGAKRGVGETREKVRELSLKGLSAREIGSDLEISTQAVYQHLQVLRESGALPEPEEASA